MGTIGISDQGIQQIRIIDGRKQFETMEELGLLNRITYVCAMKYFGQELSYDEALVQCVKGLSERVAELQNALIDKENHRDQHSYSWSLVESLPWQKFDAGSASLTSPLPAIKNLLPKLEFRINARKPLTPAHLDSSIWQLTHPLMLNVEQDENGTFVISDDVFVMFGTGETEDEALQDYISTLIEYYELLAQKNDEPTKQLFRHLQTYLRHRRCGTNHRLRACTRER